MAQRQGRAGRDSPTKGGSQGVASWSGLVVREKQLLAVYLVGGNCRLSRRRDEPVYEFLAFLLLHVSVFRRIHEHHAILVEEFHVAFDKDHQFAAVPEREPRATV